MTLAIIAYYADQVRKETRTARHRQVELTDESRKLIAEGWRQQCQARIDRIQHRKP